MFEQSLVEAGVRTRRPWTVGVSILMQSAAVGVGLLIPLVNPALLPKTAALIQLFLPPSPPPPPPPDFKPMSAPARPAQVPLQINNQLIEPLKIPRDVVIVIEPPAQPAGPGVQNALPADWSRSVNSVVESIVGQAAARPPAPPEVRTPAAETPKPIVRIVQGGVVQEALIINRVIPPYPPLARAAGIQGRVSFSAIIGRDGAIMNLQVLSGHPLLRQAAFDAVRQWRYKPTMLNGEPVEVATTIDVNFTISR